MADDFEHARFRLTPLSPIHTGTGEAFDWTNCVLDKARGELLTFDGSAVEFGPQQRAQIARFADRALASEGDAAKLVMEFQQFLKKEVVAIRRTAIRSYPVAPNLLARLDELTGSNRIAVNRETLQSLTIERCASDPRSGLPVILGSALKGALRTSWVDQYFPQNEKDMGAFDKDPFSRVAVEDFRAIARIRTAIVQAVNVQRAGERKSRGPKVPVEVVAPDASCGFEGSLRTRRRAGRSDEPDLQSLLREVRRFHHAHWSQFRSLMDGRAEAWWLRAMDDLIVAVEKTSSASLIRLGKFATAESKTTSARWIRVRVSRDRHEDRRNGTTLWLASDDGEIDGLPFGWALLEHLPNDRLSDGVVAGFARSRIWGNLTLSTEEPPVQSPPKAIPSTRSTTPGGALVADLARRLEAKTLNEDLLKAAVRDASRIADREDRLIVKTWLEKNHPDVIRAPYRRVEFVKALEKLR